MTIKFSPLTQKICLAMAIVFFLFAAGLFYVNKILLPVQVKGMAIKAASEALKRSVTFNELQYSPLHGLMITDLVIGEKDDPSRTFIRAKSASAQVLFFALLQKKLIFPSVKIVSPEVVLTRTAADTWNFSDLTAPAPAQEQPPMDMIISGFTVTNGRVILNDTSLGDNFNDVIDIPLMKGAFSLKGAFHVAGSIALPAAKGSLSFDTRIGIHDKSFKGTFKAKGLDIDRYVRFCPPGLPMAIDNLTIADAEVTALAQNGGMSLSGDITLPSLALTLNDGTKLQADLALTKMLAEMNKAGLSAQGSIQAAKASAATAAGLSARISLLRAANAQASFKDGKLSASGDLEAQEMDIALNAEQNLKASLTLQGLTLTQNAKGYAITAETKADGLSLTTGKDQAVSGDVLLKKMNVLIAGTAVQAKADVDVKNAAIDAEGTSVRTEVLAPDTRLTFDTGRLETGLHATFKGLAVKAGDITASTAPGGSRAPELTLRLVLDPNAEIPLSYAGTLMLDGIGMSGVPKVGEIKNIRGEVAFKTDSASTSDLAFSVLDTPVSVSGEISNFPAPRINAHASINKADLELAGKLIPEVLEAQGLAVKGTAAIDVAFSGLLAKPQDAKIDATAVLNDVSVDSKKLQQRASAISGTITYKAPALSWKGLSARYQGKTWTSEGSVQDFVNPAVSAVIRTDDLVANIEAKKQADKVQLTSLTGKYFDSTYELIGDIFLPPGKPALIDMNGEFKLSLRDLPKMLPAEQAKQVEALKLAGIVKIKTHVKGVPQAWQDLASVTSVETPAFYMMGYQIADLSVNAKQRDGTVDPLTVSGKLYGGDLNATAAVSLKESGFPFTAGARIENTSLELLKKDTPLKQQQLSGLVNMTADLKGELADIQRLQGTATLKIADGYLWSLEILSNVLSILSSTFQGGDVIITDADGTFRIADRKVMTDNMTLRSSTVTLVGEGWIDFDQNIDMNIRPRLEPNISGSASPSAIIINPTDGLLNIRVYNTLSKPKFEHNITAPQMIKKTIQNTVGSLLKIFE